MQGADAGAMAKAHSLKPPAPPQEVRFGLSGGGGPVEVSKKRASNFLLAVEGAGGRLGGRKGQVSILGWAEHLHTCLFFPRGWDNRERRFRGRIRRLYVGIEECGSNLIIPGYPVVSPGQAHNRCLIDTD